MQVAIIQQYTHLQAASKSINEYLCIIFATARSSASILQNQQIVSRLLQPRHAWQIVHALGHIRPAKHDIDVAINPQ
jgi:hypothetical protein